MFNSLNRFGLPIKYAVIAVLGVAIWLIIAPILGFDISSTWWGTLIGGALGGAIGGYLRQRMGKAS